MRKLRTFFVLLSLSTIPGCVGQLSNAPDRHEAITSNIGQSVKVIESGIYRYAYEVKENGEIIEPKEGMSSFLNSGDRQTFPDLIVVQWHEKSKSYYTSLKNIIFYDVSEEYFIIDYLEEDKKSYFFPAKYSNSNKEIKFYIYSCKSIPKEFKEFNDIDESKCEIRDAKTLRQAMNSIELEGLEQIVFRRYQSLPDYGEDL